ncbi:lysoplasmalogenase [Paraliomyxa miuraensis]|uniref:lysoplasmalogenase n=1 Tax=Paraliomyxa miuraensis TaxID=376150 RepID=UPI002251C5DF|nr:lysoplasmalogenase [Paraliomyxa miuraensis]MCX4245633.1 lysoplasmalogenase [Paraliomyxa miuraensis]
MLLPTLVTLAALVVLLWAEAREHGPTMRWAKPLASTGFVGAALAMGALDDDYGRAILAALALCWVGDVCLLSRRNAWFLAGLGAFLLGHVAFGAAFWLRGVDPTWAVGGVLGLVLPAMLVRRWLSPYVPSNMRRPVDAYIAVITVMVGLSWACVAAGGTRVIAVGAMAFYLSDLSVARDRFVRREIQNRLWGLPLYYVAQLLLASTIGR